MSKEVVRIEIEYEDGEIRQALGEDAESIWSFFMKAEAFYLTLQKRTYDGPSMFVVRQGYAGDTPDDARVRRTLEEIAREELSRERSDQA